MKLAIDVDMNYALERGDPALLAITAARTKGQAVLSSVLEIENATLRWIDGERNVGSARLSVLELPLREESACLRLAA